MLSLNFEFLRERRPTLAQLGAFAERYVHSDPASSLVKQRNFVEELVHALYDAFALERPFGGGLLDLMQAHQFRAAVPEVVLERLHRIRKAANPAAHAPRPGLHTPVTKEMAMDRLQVTFEVAQWFHVHVDKGAPEDCGQFCPPPPDAAPAGDFDVPYQRLLEELERERLARAQAEAAVARTVEELSKLKAAGEGVATRLHLDVDKARETAPVAEEWRLEDDAFVIDVARASPELSAGIARFSPDWREAGNLVGHRLILPRADWLAVGLPSEAGGDAEETSVLVDEWVAEHELLCRLVGLKEQWLRLELVGFPGAPGAKLILSVEGQALPVGRPPPLAIQAPDGRRVPLAPLTAWLAERAASFPADRRGQLLVCCEVRRALETWAPRLKAVPLRYSFDGFLAELQPEAPQKFALRWEPAGRRSQLATLMAEIVDAGGSRRPIRYDDFSPYGIVETNAKRPVVLPPDVARVIDAARRRERVPLRQLGPELTDPSLLVPEGVEVDRYFDLSEYSDRVVGFELVKRHDTPQPFVASGVVWFDAELRTDAPFIHVVGEDSETGATVTVAVPSPESAARMLDEAEQASATGSQALPSVRVRPTESLRLQLASALKLYGDDAKAKEKKASPAAQRGTYAAVVKELPAATTDPQGLVIDEAMVPWEVLARVTLPGVDFKIHQRRGIAWLLDHANAGTPGVLLADDMGLGKTLQAAAFLAIRCARGPRATTSSFALRCCSTIGWWSCLASSGARRSGRF